MGTAIKGPCFIFEFILDRDPSKLPTKAKNSIKNGMSAVILEIYGIKPRTSGAATGNKFVVVTDPLGVLPTSSDLSAFQPSVEEKLGKLAKLVEIRVGEMNDKSIVFKTAGYKINTSITQLPLPLLGSLPAPNKPHSSTKPSETVTKVPQKPVVPLSLPAPQIHSAKEPVVTNNPVEPVIQNNQPQISATPNPSEPAVPAKVKQIPPIENPQPVPVNNPPAPERPNLPVELKLNFDPTAWSGDADEKTLLTSLKRIWPATGLGKPADADVLKRSQGIYIVRFVPTVPNGDPQTVLNTFVTQFRQDQDNNLWNKLMSAYFQGITSYGPQHRSLCDPLHHDLPQSDEICLSDQELTKIATQFLPEVPTTRQGLVMAVEKHYGSDQRTWSDGILLDFYRLVWRIIGRQDEFPFTTYTAAQRWFREQGIVTENSVIWSENFMKKYNWKPITQPTFGDKDILAIYLETTRLAQDVRNALKPVITTRYGLLEDIDIQRALESYSRDPKYQFEVYLYRLAYENDKANPFTAENTPKPPGVTKFAFVLNTVPLDNAGSHWVCLYIDIAANEADYMDSEAVDITARPIVVYYVQNALGLIKNWFPNFTPTVDTLKSFKNRHQYGGIECGVFVTHFVISRLEGVSMEDLDNSKIDDQTCQRYRTVYWRTL